LLSDDLDDWLWSEWGCRLQNSLPYAHWQNAVERDMQTVVNGASTLLHAQSWLKADAWDLALWHYIDLRNASPNSKHSESARFILTKQPTDFDSEFLFSFGDLLAVRLPGEGSNTKEWKFDLKNELGIYCGQPVEKRGSLVYWPADGKTSVRAYCYKIVVTDRQFLQYHLERAIKRSGPTSYTDIANAFHDFSRAVEGDSELLSAWHEELKKPLTTPLVDLELGETQPDDSSRLSLPHNAGSSAPRHTRSRGAPELSAGMDTSAGFMARTATDYQPSYSSYPVASNAPAEDRSYPSYSDIYSAHLLSSFNAHSAKLTVGKALSSEQRTEWVTAIRLEINTLISGGTLVATSRQDIAVGAKVIHSTMQLKLKMHQSGAIDKFKARLCACGNELYGDTKETFSPTVGALTYATVHQLAILDELFRCTVDTVGAYLYQEYPSSSPALYLVLSPNVAETCGLDPTVHYRIGKYLYGLPDAGLAYYKAYSAHLVSRGYKRTSSDSCLFVKITGKVRTYVFTHVDDTFVCSTHKDELDIFVAALRERFNITVVNNVEEYLGISMETMPNGDVLLTQPKLLEQLFEEYHLELVNVRPPRGDYAPQRIVDTQAIITSTPMAQADYLHLLGALIYITKSRPDIATAVSFSSTYSAHPTTHAFTELIYCLYYLWKTRTTGLLLKQGTRGEPLLLHCYVDASYLTHRDSRSHSGYCLSFGTVGCFYAKSGKQTLVATSSTHAEMRALYSCVVDVIYVVNLCSELGRPISLPCVIMEDNQPVLDLTLADVTARVKRCKHFLMLISFIKEQVVSGLIHLKKVDTRDNVADILTKIVTGSEFTRKAALLLGNT
jgi:hypothetical protein